MMTYIFEYGSITIKFRQLAHYQILNAFIPLFWINLIGAVIVDVNFSRLIQCAHTELFHS